MPALINELIQIEEQSIKIMSHCSKLAIKYSKENDFISDSMFNISKSEERFVNKITDFIKTLVGDPEQFNKINEKNNKAFIDSKYLQSIYSSIVKRRNK